ncbi:MAG: tetratricopeptide repeat protein [Chitinophagaceae bacterium]|nr:tetratricopeptide repeat protein [Chitinophagaceae bacterium]
MSASKSSKSRKIAVEKSVGAKPATSISSPNSKTWIYLLTIILATVIVFGPSINNQWTNWDDESYVLKNPLVTGFDIKGIFKEEVMGNYHPVTIFTLAIEYSLFKDDASGYHTVSMLLHLLNALLLFYFIRLLTGNALAAFIAALLFAIHPMHVESVSWISAQKDLLYTMFYFAALLAYLRYRNAATGQGMVYYTFMLVLFTLSLLSKAQAVTLPVILLLVDWYRGEKFTGRLLLEKVPLFVLALAFGIMAIFAQQATDAIQDIALYSFPERLMFAAYAIVNYLVRLAIPINLSAYYPYPEEIKGSYTWLVYTAPVIVLILGFLLYRLRKKSTYLLFGVLFFLVNIFLVLQLLPVGGALLADRYTYLSFTGLFFVLAILATRVWENQLPSLSTVRLPVVVAGIAWILFLAYQCQSRTKVWLNSEILWTDVIAKYPHVPIAYSNLGSYYQEKEQLVLAKKNMDEAIRLNPNFSQALINRSDIYRVFNKIDSAIMDGNRAVALSPNDPDAYMNRGIAFSIAEKNDSALKDFTFVISQQPENARAYNNLGNLYMIKEMPDSALINYNLALQYDPKFLDVHNNRGLAYLKLGNNQAAINDLTTAIANDPNLANNYYFRMQAYEKMNRFKEALADAQVVQKLGMEIPADYLQQLANGAGSGQP